MARRQRTTGVLGQQLMAPSATTHGDTTTDLTEEYATPQHVGLPVSRPFQDTARSRVDLARLERHWGDMLRTITSIHTGAVRASTSPACSPH
ncbi:hypothetical protein HY68_35795 [Streptomyces sp. AcH 505]|nr:hypothetical protein HY68_35795 [Streptomyces sp. AcH 505]